MKHENMGTSLLKNYWLFFVGFAMMLVIFMTNTNHDLFFLINSHHAIIPDAVWSGIIYVSAPQNGILSLALLLITWFFRRNKIVNVMLLIFAYFLFFGLIKIIFHEARPYIQYNPLTFHWLPQPHALERAYRSFPSGHTGNMAVFVFALSYFFAQKKLWLRILLVALLIITMFAQICGGWHFPIDVLASGLIGFGLVQACFSRDINRLIYFVQDYIQHKFCRSH